MKKLYIVVPLSLIMLQSNCYCQKIESLEVKNKQLLHQVDSLTIALAKAKQETMNLRTMAETERVIADKNAIEARRQINIALTQADSATRAKNRAIMSAREAYLQRMQADRQRMKADSIRQVADKNAMEARRLSELLFECQEQLKVKK
jgi:hypothetical protein